MKPSERFDWLGDVLADTQVCIPGKLVAALIAVMVNGETGEAHPGRQYIAEHTGLSTGSVWNGLRSLESQGHIRRTSTHGRICCTYHPIRHVVTGSTRQEVMGSEAATCHLATPTRHTVNSNPSHGDVEHGSEHGKEHGYANEARFAIRGSGEWQLSNDLFTTLATAYPDRDLDAELAKAAAWCATNSSRRKTASGMPRFLNNWLRNAKPHATQGEAANAEGMPTPDANAWEAAEKIEKELINE